MLTYFWRTELSSRERTELEELATRAAAEDAEAGFSRLVVDAGGRPGVHHLLVRMLPRETGESLGLATVVDDADLPLVAHLRLRVDDAAGEIRYVVDPEYRSLGVSTLLVELLGLDTEAPGGWAGTGARSLTVWAHGNHPATRRMARRCGARVTRRLWKMARPFYGELAEPLPDEPLVAGVRLRTMDADRDGPGVRALVDDARVPDGGVGRWTVVDVAAFEESGPWEPDDVVVAVDDAGSVLGALCVEPSSTPAGRGSTGRVRLYAVDRRRASLEVQEALVLRALHVLRDRGHHDVSVYVDSEQDELVKVLMAATIEHEHSDVCYAVP